MIASRNDLIYKDKRDTSWYQQHLIFFSETAKIGDYIENPSSQGKTVIGKCNFSIAGEAYTLNEELLTGIGHELMRKGLYRSVDDPQENLQQAEDKKQDADLFAIKKIGDLPINWQEYTNFNKDQAKNDLTLYFYNFFNTFLSAQYNGMIKFKFEYVPNTYVLYYVDEHLKLSVHNAVGKLDNKQVMGALEFRDWILNNHRWKFLTLRYGDQQSLVKTASMQMSGELDSYAKYTTEMGSMSTIANAGAPNYGARDALDDSSLDSVQNEGTTNPKRRSAINNPQGDPNTSPVYGPLTYTDSITVGYTKSNISKDASTNSVNKGAPDNMNVLKNIMRMGFDDENIDSHLGTYLKSFFTQVNCSIHGTMSLAEGMLVYFVGMFEWLRGFYMITNIQHSISPGGFETSFTLTWQGSDKGGAVASLNGKSPIDTHNMSNADNRVKQ
jgi:hypothetical protein